MCLLCFLVADSKMNQIQRLALSSNRTGELSGERAGFTEAYQDRAASSPRRAGLLPARSGWVGESANRRLGIQSLFHVAKDFPSLGVVAELRAVPTRKTSLLGHRDIDLFRFAGP